MAIKETVASLAAKRGYLVSEVAEEMSRRGYDGEAYLILTGKLEGCYRCTVLLGDILSLNQEEMREVQRAMHKDAEKVVNSWSSTSLLTPSGIGVLYVLLEVISMS